MTTDGWGGHHLELADPHAPPVLSRSTLDRAAGHRGDRGWLEQAWTSGRVRLLRVGPDGVVPTHSGDGTTRLRLEEPLPWQPLPDDALLLGADDKVCYVATLDGEDRGLGLRELGAVLDDTEAGLLTTAVALAGWHRSHTHCPRCGAPTVVVASGWATRCTVDGSEHFPRTDPAVIVLVVSPGGAQAVLGRQPSWPRGRYSCLAGFVEAGESAEQAVVREVAEEAGIAVWAVTPVASQPWPFPRSLMLGFTAVADPDATPDVGDAELEDVRWFTRDAVRAGEVLLPPPVSIANGLLSRWLAEG